MTLRVLIIGGGVGGLCLAQGLHGAGIEARVFERNATAASRNQGYRLRIDEHGIRALRRCLPEDLFELFEATSNPLYQPRGAVFNHHLEQVESFGESPGAADPARASTVANRRTLRQVLLAGLGDAVQFNREAVRVSETATSASAHFADGSVETGDLVIAADGINSVVRQQKLPHAELYDTGLRAVYGHSILDRRLLDLLPEALFGGSSPVLGPAGTTLAVGVYRPCQSPQRAAATIAPYAWLSHVPDYVKWTLVAPPASLGVTEEEIWTLHPLRLHEIARKVTADWHPALADLVATSDGPMTFALSIRAGLPVDPWPATRITLLGDAIHATTPVGGTGANTALRDAEQLTGLLAQADAGRLGVIQAVACYEELMRDYGFAAAQRSLRGAELVFRAPALALS